MQRRKQELQATRDPLRAARARDAGEGGAGRDVVVAVGVGGYQATRGRRRRGTKGGRGAQKLRVSTYIQYRWGANDGSDNSSSPLLGLQAIGTPEKRDCIAFPARTVSNTTCAPSSPVLAVAGQSARVPDAGSILIILIVPGSPGGAR